MREWNTFTSIKLISPKERAAANPTSKGSTISGKLIRFLMSNPMIMVTNIGLTGVFSNGRIFPSISGIRSALSITPIASSSPGSSFIQPAAGCAVEFSLEVSLFFLFFVSNHNFNLCIKWITFCKKKNPRLQNAGSFGCIIQNTRKVLLQYLQRSFLFHLLSLKLSWVLKLGLFGSYIRNEQSLTKLILWCFGNWKWPYLVIIGT